MASECSRPPDPVVHSVCSSQGPSVSLEVSKSQPGSYGWGSILNDILSGHLSVLFVKEGLTHTLISPPRSSMSEEDLSMPSLPCQNPKSGVKVSPLKLYTLTSEAFSVVAESRVCFRFMVQC